MNSILDVNIIKFTIKTNSKDISKFSLTKEKACETLSNQCKVSLVQFRLAILQFQFNIIDEDSRI